jgi:hypothetical protein
MKYAIEIGSHGMIYIHSFMKIGTGIQAILSCICRNFRGCNIGNAKGNIQ